MIDKRLWIGMLMAFLLIAMAVQAQAKLSLGSTQGSGYAEIEQGGEGSFRVFLFNAHQEEEIQIYMGVYEDAGISVSIEPESLLVPYSEPGRCTDMEEDEVCLGTPEGDVKARAVTVRVSVPFGADLGEHEVSVYAATERQEGTLGSAQIRRFYFTVDVQEGEGLEFSEEVDAETGEEEVEEPEVPEEEPEPEEEVEEEPEDSITGAVTGIPVIGPLVLAGVIAIFLVMRRLKKI